MSVTNGKAVYTLGWDTVFGIPVPNANKAIVDKKSSPKKLSYSEPDFSLTCNFGDWQICKGGGGKNICFSIPLSNIELTYTSNKKVVKCDSGTVIIEVNMHFVPHTENNGTKSNLKALMVRSKSESDSDPAAILKTLKLNGNLGDFNEAVIGGGLKQWFNGNLGEFNHIFSVVELNKIIDHGKWGFVTPNYVTYGFLGGKTIDDSILGILSMTGDRQGNNIASQIAYDIIPEKSEAGFLISQKRTLSDLVRPAIEQAYPGLNKENFLLSDDATTLYLKEGVSVNVKSVKHGGTVYQPVLKQLSVQSSGEILTLQSYTETEIVPGITAKCTATNWYRIELGTSDKGQTLKFVEAQPASIEHSISQSEGSIITQVIIGIVAAIALIILIIATSGAALIVGGLIAGLIGGADAIVPAIIKDINTNSSPAIDLLLVNAVSPVKWTDSSDFKLNYASLNVSMQLGGDSLFT